MKTSTYLFFLFLINLLVGASILQMGANIVLIQKALPFLPAWVFPLIGWGFIASSVLCLFTRLVWSPFAQRFIPATIIRNARMFSLTLSLCSVAPWAAIAGIETIFLHSALVGAVVYAVMVWTEARELKYPDLTPAIEHQVLILFKQTRISHPLKDTQQWTPPR